MIIVLAEQAIGSSVSENASFGLLGWRKSDVELVRHRSHSLP